MGAGAGAGAEVGAEEGVGAAAAGALATGALVMTGAPGAWGSGAAAAAGAWAASSWIPASAVRGAKPPAKPAGTKKGKRRKLGEGLKGLADVGELVCDESGGPENVLYQILYCVDRVRGKFLQIICHG